MIRDAGLTTYVLSGPRLAEAAMALKGADGVEQVAPFGNTLHLVGRDAAALRASVERVAADTGTSAIRAESSLEDVFIQLMGNSTDNTA